MKINQRLSIFLINMLCICYISNICYIFSEIPIKKGLHENTFGKLIKGKTRLHNPPWKVTRCDQIAIVNREMIPDHEDFKKRKKVSITITAYYINIFSDEDPNHLLHSIHFTNMLPRMQRGADGCVLIKGGQNEHSSIICGNNIQEGKYIYEAVMEFYKCRNKHIAPKKQPQNLKRVMRACGLKSGFSDPKAIKKRIKELQMQKKKRINPLNRRNTFVHLGWGGVPGAY